MPKTTHLFTAKLAKFSGPSGWYFVYLPKTLAKKIGEQKTKMKAFGSIPVSVEVGSSRWKTSIFKDTKAKTFILFVKAAVRKKESLEIGDSLHVKLTV